MRLFTDEEKTILRRIAEKKGGNLYNFIDQWIEGVSFHVATTTNIVTIFFDTNEFGSRNLIEEKLHKVQSILIQAVNLLQLFESKGYLFSYKNANQIPNPFIFGQAVINSPSTPSTFPDPRLSELIVKYATQEIFVTDELEKFINDGFITREEVRADRQFNVTSTALRTTRKALYVTTTGVLLTLAFNLYNSFLKDSHSPQPTFMPLLYDSSLKTNKFDSTNLKKNVPVIDSSTLKKDTTKKKK